MTPMNADETLPARTACPIEELPDLSANCLPHLDLGAPVAWCDVRDEVIE
jgi:hypothetical protein